MKPILFNTEMVRAILEGRKTVTRRKVDIDIINSCDIDVDGSIISVQDEYGDFCNIMDYAPYQIGDLLYVRETWNVDRVHTEENKIGVRYKADNSFAWVDVSEEKYDKYDRSIAESNFDSWKPSIHMPKEAARIFLKVTDVRVERLHDMDYMDAVYEGIDVPIDPETGYPAYNPLDDFINLWDSAIKKKDLHIYGWDSNPYVWAIEFDRCEKLESEGI